MSSSFLLELWGAEAVPATASRVAPALQKKYFESTWKERVGLALDYLRLSVLLMNSVNFQEFKLGMTKGFTVFEINVISLDFKTE